jgi:preprotein translocase subunit SecD
MKYQATGNDSIRIVEIEKQLADDVILKKISSAFDEVFSNNEINDLYNFIQTSAFDKFFNSGETYKIIASEFKEIDKEIEEITNNFSNSADNKIVDLPRKKFEPIPVDKEDGFYATVDYTYLTEDKDIKLEKNPSLASTDILEIEKVYRNYNDNRPEISIVLTKEGARKFYLLTKENIGKPIAIVIDKKIVSIPKVQSEIMGGKVSISGDFSEKEIDKMIEKLKGK